MYEDLALLVLRLTVGLLFVGHGSQKLLGWFGGEGPEGTAASFDKMRVKEAPPAAYVAGTAEWSGGALLALGLLTPIACAALFGVMLGAIFLAHWPRFWVQKGGFEYPLVNAAIVTMFGIGGPGAWSLDEAIGIEGVLARPWAYLVLACLAATAVAAIMLTRKESHERWRRPSDGGRLASEGR
jgi:putative oxidoreductase